MAVVLVALFGAVVGGVLLGGFGGAVFGFVIGGVTGWVADLAARVRTLERKLEARKVLEARVATETATPPRTDERETPPTAMEGGSAANAGSNLRQTTRGNHFIWSRQPCGRRRARRSRY